MVFWIITGALAVVSVALMALTIIRGRVDGEPPAAYDLRVYRDQLKEVDRDLARGVIAPEDAERLRAEISRRVLTADAQVRAAEIEGKPANGPARILAGVLALGVGVGGFALYQRLGAPGYGDLPRQDRIAMAKQAYETRPAQAEVEAQMPPRADIAQPAPDFATLMEKLREAVAGRPDDVQGHVLLARNEAVLGNFTAAYGAQERVLTLLGEAATAQDYVDYADMMILAAGGYVSPEAERALRGALARDERNGAARYYMGLMLAQTGRPDRAFAVWNALLNEGPQDAVWIAPIREQIEEMAFRAGVKFTMPAQEGLPQDGLRGPTQADIAAAGDMTDADRQAMIRNMVEGLNTRLAEEGGTPAEWSRLIGAYGILGEVDKARAIWAEAQVKFATQPDALDEIRGGARRAGVAE